MENQNELVEVIKKSQLEVQTGNYIQEQFLPFFQQAEEWKQKAESLIVTDVSQTEEMKLARESRLALKNVRINADKTRKKLKEDSLRYGKAVQGVYNVIEYLIVPIEKHLEDQEKFVERIEAQKKLELKETRESELQPYIEFVPYGIDLANLSNEDFDKLLNGAKIQLKIKIDAEKKAEEERIAKEKQEAEERERVRIENEKLKAEAEKIRLEVAKAEAERKAIEEKAAKEREAAEAKLKAERDAKIKIENELKAKAEAERKAIEEKAAKEKEEAELKAEEERKAQAAPDRAKLIDFANKIDSLTCQDLQSKEARDILKKSMNQLVKVSNYIREKSLL